MKQKIYANISKLMNEYSFKNITSEYFENIEIIGEENAH